MRKKIIFGPSFYARIISDFTPSLQSNGFSLILNIARVQSIYEYFVKEYPPTLQEMLRTGLNHIGDSDNSVRSWQCKKCSVEFSDEDTIRKVLYFIFDIPSWFNRKRVDLNVR